MADDDQKTGPSPLDPTTGADDLMGDTSGLTGITVNKTQSDQAQGTGSVANTIPATGNQTNNPSSSDAVRGTSDVMNAKAEDIASGKEKIIDAGASSPSGQNQPLGSNVPADSGMALPADPDDNTQQRVMPPSVQGEQSVSGDMPHPESDDDTLANAQAMGMQPQEDSEHPQELDIARDVDKAEESLRNS